MAYIPTLEKGNLIPPGNFRLSRKIESIDVLWHILNTERSVFARHRMYPTAFFLNWPIINIYRWLGRGWFWTAESVINPKDL